MSKRLPEDLTFLERNVQHKVVNLWMDRLLRQRKGTLVAPFQSSTTQVRTTRIIIVIATVTHRHEEICRHIRAIDRGVVRMCQANRHMG